MSTYVALPTATYARIFDRTVAAYGTSPWDAEDVELHLRYLAGEVAAGRMGPGRRERFPTTRELGVIFNWRHVRVAEFLKATTTTTIRRNGLEEVVEHLHWQDPYQPIPLEQLTGDRLVGANRRTAGEREANGEQTARTDERAESGATPNGGRTGSEREANAVRVSFRAGTPVPGTQIPPGVVTPACAPARDEPEPAAIPDDALPRWVPSGRELGGYRRDDVFVAVIGAIEETRGRPPNPSGCATDAREVLGLWKALGRPAPSTFGADARLVARWAQDAPDRLAARDIRAEGWAEGTDRSRSLATLCRRDKWGDRLAAAQAWDARGRPHRSEVATGPPARAAPGRRRTIAEMLAEEATDRAPPPRILLTPDTP